ncbi:TonB-dependent receptor domain-containing protein [Chitinibacter sp. S2-10]|uniref:TonB-dependent receptor domain-containing protein n=1 Tax=Chitinibacter sp. S2-10 TaxID=3373597 RepID=UPI003977E401
MQARFSKLYLLVLSTAPLSIPFYAHAEVTQLDEIVVTASRLAQPVREVVGDVTLISSKEIAGSADLLEVLSRQPGIQINQAGGAGKPSAVFMRGNSNRHTLVLVDGMRLGSATLGIAALQNIPLSQIDRIEILRGPAASLYGSDAIGGVIQIFTRQGQAGSGAQFNPSAELGIGTQNSVSASAGFTGTTGGDAETRYAFNLAHERTDGINAIVNQTNPAFYADKDGYTNTSLSASLSHRIAAGHELGGSVLAAWGDNQFDGYLYDSFYNPVAQSYDYHNESLNGSANVWLKNQFAQHWQSKILLGSSIDQDKTFNPVSASDYRDDVQKIKTKQNMLNWQNDIELSTGTLTLGAETLSQQVSGSQAYAQDHRRINSVQAGFLAHWDAVTLQVNGRSDDNSQFGRANTGNLGLSWQANSEWQLGGTMGTAFKAPTFNDLYWPTDAYGGGNPNLKPEDSNNKELFVRYASNQLQLSLTGYYNKVNNLIEWSETSPYFYQPSNVGTALLKGSTLQADWQRDAVLAGLSYDYLDASDQSGGLNDGNQLARRAKHAGLAYLGWRQTAWDVRIEWQAVGERYNDAANLKRMSGYALANLAANWQLDKDWTLKARLNNVFDRQYEVAKDYGSLGVNGMLTVSWAPK